MGWEDPWSPTAWNIAFWVASVPLALLYSNFLEWILHRLVLHGLGRNRSSFWSFHWHDHHNHARLNGFYDESYRLPAWRWNPKSKEILSLQGLNLVHLPLLFVTPIFYLALVYTNLRYYQIHKRSHLDPEWARKHVPWHYDHHMGPDQDKNWCVTRPWFDLIAGTREVFDEPAERPAKSPA